MRLRPYINEKDYEYVSKWVSDERIHALWCANLIPYPLSEEGLREVLDKDAREWGGCAYTITDDAGTPIGFFVYSINNVNNSGFLKFVVLDSELRGKGVGTQMVTLILKYAFDVTGVSEIHLNVFDVNIGARKCYSNAGFIEESIIKDAFTYENEQWGRCHMVAAQ